MGKNKLNSKNPGKHTNPIYKKAAASVTKAKSKAKPVKTNLKQLKMANKEAIASLDQKVGAFRAALQDKDKSKKIASPQPTKPTQEQPPVNMEEAVEGLSKL